MKKFVTKNSPKQSEKDVQPKPVNGAKIGEGDRFHTPTDGMFISPTPEMSKIKLIIALEKLKNIGVEYSLVSAYFKSSFEKLYKRYSQYRTLAMTLTEMLVFDKEELKDDAACYIKAFGRIKACSYTDFSIITYIVDGIASTVSDLR